MVFVGPRLLPGGWLEIPNAEIRKPKMGEAGWEFRIPNSQFLIHQYRYHSGLYGPSTGTSMYSACSGVNLVSLAPS